MIREVRRAVSWIGFPKCDLALIYCFFKDFGCDFVAERPVSAGALKSVKLRKDGQ
jgi:hypothetical protein